MICTIEGHDIESKFDVGGSDHCMFDAPVQVNLASRTGTAARRYRVLMVAPTSFFADYGCHVRILEEARMLRGLGHHVTIVTYHNGRDLPGIDIRRTLSIPWRRNYEVGSSRHKIAFDALLGIKTLNLLLKERYDVIHAHLHEGALIGEVLGKLFRIPVVFDFQGSLTEEMIDHGFVQRESWVYRPLRWLEERIDRSSSVIITSSSHAERILTEEFGCNPARICPLPDCVNTRTFKPAADLDTAELMALRQRLGIPTEARVIVYLGLLAGYQGTDVLLEAMQMIRGRCPDVYLLLMGFPDVDFYQLRAEDLGIRDRVIFTGRVLYEEAPIHLALGDVAVSPKAESDRKRRQASQLHGNGLADGGVRYASGAGISGKTRNFRRARERTQLERKAV